MKRLVLAVVAALSVLVPAAPVQASVAADDYSDTAHHATNAKRVEAGLGKLKKNACLHRMALEQAKRMAQRGKLFHQDLTHVQSGCDMGWVGENVAYGYANGVAVVRAWMNSPEHRANILKDDYRLMGIAGVKRDGVWWVSQVFGSAA